MDRTHFFLFVVPCSLRTQSIMLLHIFLFLITVCKLYILAISPNPYSTNHIQKLVWLFTLSFLLTFNILCGCQIRQALLPHFVPQKFQLSPPNTAYMCSLCFNILQKCVIVYVRSMGFPVSFCRATFMLPQVSYPYVMRCPSIQCNIGGLISRK